MTLLITDPSRQIDDLYGKFARIGTFFRNVSKTLSILTEISNFQEVPGPDMGKGRDGTVPRFFVPVPKYQDSLSRGILIAGLFRRFLSPSQLSRGFESRFRSWVFAGRNRDLDIVPGQPPIPGKACIHFRKVILNSL